MPKQRVTQQLHCRIPVEVYQAARAKAEGKHALGQLVSDALQAHLGFLERYAATPEEIAEAVLAALKGRL